jgi:hypothetical protein
MASPIALSASDVHPVRLKRVLNEYFTYERAQAFRRCVVGRVVLVALLLWAFRSTAILSRSAFWIAVAVLTAMACAAWVVELRAGIRFQRELTGIPTISTPECRPALASADGQKVIKNS